MVKLECGSGSCESDEDDRQTATTDGESKGVCDVMLRPDCCLFDISI